MLCNLEKNSQIKDYLDDLELFKFLLNRTVLIKLKNNSFPEIKQNLKKLSKLNWCFQMSGGVLEQLLLSGRCASSLKLDILTLFYHCKHSCTFCS